MKTCTRCKQLKPLDCFWNCYSNTDGKNYHCIECMKDKYAKSVGKTVDQIRRGIKSEVINGKKLCSKCGLWKEIKYFYKVTDFVNGLSYRCVKCSRIDGRAYNHSHRTLKMEFIQVYGGMCDCCGETEFGFLLSISEVKGIS